ncbi:MAG: hypothetical protein V2I43_17945 [Parvularcula sp.]|jgi:ornithine cyclodeaminase|nr:hypothetical protein [Parvularcula sp.]
MGRAFERTALIPPRSVISSRSAEAARDILVKPAAWPEGIGIVKTVYVVRGTASQVKSSISVFSPEGELQAVVAGDTLTALRTAAASAYASRRMRGKLSGKLAVLGTGRQAEAQTRAFVEAHDITEVAVWGRRQEAAADLVKALSDLPVRVRPTATSADAVEAARIVTAATASTRPMFERCDVEPGSHIDLVGGFRPDMREATDDLFTDAVVVADTATALLEAGDLIGPIASGHLREDSIRFLADVDGPLRLSGTQISLFKSVGYAAEDLVAIELLLQKLEMSGAR